MSAADGLAVRRIVTGEWSENCWVVSAPGGDAAIVDPGGEAAAIAEHVEANGLRPRAVVATHGHHDHLGAAGEIVERYGVPFCIHSAESDLLARVNFFRLAFHRLGPVEVPAVDVDLAETASLAFGELEIGVVHTPGHSPGSVCLEISDRLFTGDTLMAMAVGTTEMLGADPAQLDASVRRLVGDYAADTANHPGHGEPGRLGDAVAGLAPTPESRA